MKLPRLTIRRLMALVATVALGFSLVAPIGRWLEGRRRDLLRLSYDHAAATVEADARGPPPLGRRRDFRPGRPASAGVSPGVGREISVGEPASLAPRPARPARAGVTFEDPSRGHPPPRPLTPVRSASIMGPPTRPLTEGRGIPVRASILHASRSASRRPLSAAVLVLACLLAGEAGASSVSGVASFDAASHARDCRCGPKCRGDSCCCGSPKPVSSPKPTGSPKDPSRKAVSESPCLNPAPCHDPLLPPSTPVSSSEKAEASRSFDPPPSRVGRRMAPSRSSRLPSDRRASRLDRPPRAPASA